MAKAQTGILGVVILTGIVLIIVSVTYLWGQPLIQKNVDQAHINLVMEKLEEINDAILYTSSTGSNSIVSLDLSSSSFIVDPQDNRIIFETISSVPIISSTNEVPINYYELAEVRESITFNATSTESTDPIIGGYNSGPHHTNTTIGNEFYNVSIYQNTTSSNWELLCLWNTTLTINSDCGRTGQAIVQEGVTTDVLSIVNDGKIAYALGDYIENQGILGSEPSGIISASSISVQDTERITFYLTYRGMISQNNEIYKIIVDCETNCVASNSNKELVISRENIIMNSNEVTTYINLRVQ